MSFASLMRRNEARMAKYLNFIYMTQTILPKCQRTSEDVNNFLLVLLALELKTKKDKNMKFILTVTAISKLHYSIRSEMRICDRKRLGSFKKFLLNLRTNLITS